MFIPWLVPVERKVPWTAVPVQEVSVGLCGIPRALALGLHLLDLELEQYLCCDAHSVTNLCRTNTTTILSAATGSGKEIMKEKFGLAGGNPGFLSVVMVLYKLLAPYSPDNGIVINFVISVVGETVAQGEDVHGGDQCPGAVGKTSRDRL